MPKRYLILQSNAHQTCGVEEFARQLARHTPGRSGTFPLEAGIGELGAQLRDIDGVVLNFPIVAWKKRLVAPVLAALAARLRRKEVVVVLHEWSALDWKRRVVLAPAVALATRLVFSAPEIADEFKASPLSAVSTSDRQLIPIPPNLLAPEELVHSAAKETLQKQRHRGRLILGQFGSIYPKKQSTAVLDVGERLMARGHDVFVVFVGSFIKGNDDVEQDFFRRAQAAGLAERVLVTGYVGDDRELFGIFEEIDVFCYLFPEGLTSRRGSVLAAALFGKPVVVNAPARADALEHHALYRKLIDSGAIRLVPMEADADIMAEAIATQTASPLARVEEGEIDALWRTVGQTIGL